jgi:hypothetical protein
LILQIHARKRGMLAWRCIPIGMGVAQVGLIAWAIRIGGTDGAVLIPLGVIFAGFLGFAYGVLAILVVPWALYRKPVKLATIRLFILTSTLTVLATVITGFFPFCPAGCSLCAATLWIAITMPNERLHWSRTRCISCAYDLSASPTDQCPECGLSAIDMRSAASNETFPRATALTVAWVAIVLLAWVVATVWMEYAMEPLLP